MINDMQPIRNAAELQNVKPLDQNVYNFPTRKKGCKNVCWAVLFFITFSLFTGGGIYVMYQTFSSVSSFEEAFDTFVNNGDILKKINVPVLFQSILVAALVSIVVVFVSLCMLQVCTGSVIRASFIAYAVLCVMDICYLFNSQRTIHIYWAYINIFWLVIISLYMCIGWSNIAYAEACIKIALQALFHNMCILMIPMIFTILAILQLFTFFFSLAAIKMAYENILGRDEGAPFDKTEGKILFGFAFFCYVWITLVYHYVSHTTCCAYIAGLLLLGEYTSTVCQSFGLALRNIGAISFGSAILAAIKTLRMLAENAIGDDDNGGNRDGIMVIIGCIALCILKCVEDMVEYLTEYAYVFVALYEEDFISAAKDSWDLFKHRGFDMIVNDDFTNIPMVIFSLLAGKLSRHAAIYYVDTYLTEDLTAQKNSILVVSSSSPATHVLLNTQSFASGFAFLLGFMITGIFYGVISSYIKTIFVIYAQHPKALSISQPAAYMELHNAICGQIQTDPERYQKQIL